MSNQARLFVLVFLAFLPTVALYSYADRSLKSAELQNHTSELLHLANRAGLEYRRIVSDTETLLGALAEMEEFRNPRQPRCSEALASVMRHANHYTAIQLIEPDGFVTCGSLAINESLYVGDRYYHRAAIANQQFTIGNFVVGRLTGKPILGLAHPITGTSSLDVTGVMAAYLDLHELMNAFYQMDVPTGATLTVIDRSGRIMIRVPEGVNESGADTIGATVPSSFPVPSGEIRGPYLLEGLDLDGVSRRFAVEPLESAGRRASGHLLVGMSEERMLEDVDVIAARQLQILALAGLFMFALAWLFGHYTLLRDPKVAGAPTGPDA